MKFVSPILIFVFLFCFSRCKKYPSPESGFNEPFYVKFNFEGEEIKYEETDVTPLGFWSGGPSSGWANGYGSYQDAHRIGLRITYDKNPIKKSDILDLEGRTISTTEDEFPWIRLFIEDNENSEHYYNGLSNIDYGDADVYISEVIKGPRIDVGDEKKRSYILRGEFCMNLSDSWNINIPDTLYPVTNGEFSMKVYVP